MDVVFLAGSHPRHQYIARKLESLGYLKGLVIQNMGPHVPEPPEDLTDEHLRELYTHHFECRRDAELNFFGEADIPDVDTLKVDIGELNTPEMWEFVTKRSPDLTLSYGIKILNDRSLKKISDNAWNIHGGLSPLYKGGITHFWPSYMLEPQMTGITLHELTMDLDGGDIIHQSTGPLVEGDGVHQLACRTVKDFTDNHLPKVLDLFERGELSEPEPQKRHGKMWYKSDWRPEHLKTVYEKYDNSIVDMFLQGEIEGREPNLVTQF